MKVKNYYCSLLYILVYDIREYTYNLDSKFYYYFYVSVKRLSH